MSDAEISRETVGAQFVLPASSKRDSQILLSKTDTGDRAPTDEAARIAAKLRSSVQDVIAACVLVSVAHAKYSSDNSTCDEFINALVAEGVLAPKEARLGAAQGTKLSMLKSIGEHADLLCSPEVLARLQPGHTILYQVGVLYKNILGDEAERLARLVRILNDCEGDLNRKYLLDQTRRIKKRGSKSVSAIAQVVDPVDVIQGGLYDQLLFTPSRDDLRVLAADYVNPAELTQCLRSAGLAAEQAVAVVIAAMRDIQIIVDRLLPSCGFGRPSHILLAREPKSPDVTESFAIVIATRGEGAIVSVPQDLWDSTSKNLDPSAIASELIQGGSRKLHVFAEHKAEPQSGWTSLIGEQNWVERPTLQ